MTISSSVGDGEEDVDVALRSQGEPTVVSGEGLARQVKPRQMMMMGLGCAIGTGLFVGSGKGIAAAGPAILLAFTFGGLLVILIMRMLGEMATADPQSGSISVFAEKAIGRTAGYTVGWLWWSNSVVSIAAEAVAAAAVINAVWPSSSPWLLSLIFLVTLTAANLVGVSKFGEMEFWFALLKVIAIVAFLVFGAALLLGLVPAAHLDGLSNLWSHGGFAPTGLSGLAAGLLLVVFAFGGIEIVTIASAEARDPEQSISRAIRSTVWRILLFYIGSVFIMVSVLPWTDPMLAKSPFVAVLTFAGVPGASAVMSIVIVIALLSSLNANLYAASRLLFSLSERGCAPAGLTRLSRRRAPQMAVLASVAFGFVTVFLNYLMPERILGFLFNVVGSTTIVLWSIVIASQIILRNRAERAGVVLRSRMWGFPYLSYLALAMLAVIVGLSFFDAAARTQLLATFACTLVIAVLCRFLARPSVPAAMPVARDDASSPTRE